MIGNPDTAAVLLEMSKREGRKLAKLLATCRPGESVQIHFDACPADIEGVIVSDLCNCRPIILRAGARA